MCVLSRATGSFGTYYSPNSSVFLLVLSSRRHPAHVSGADSSMLEMDYIYFVPSSSFCGHKTTSQKRYYNKHYTAVVMAESTTQCCHVTIHAGYTRHEHTLYQGIHIIRERIQETKKANRKKKCRVPAVYSWWYL